MPEIHLYTAYVWFLRGQKKRMRQNLRRAYRSPLKPRTGYTFHMLLGTDHLNAFRPREALEEYARAEQVARTPLLRARAITNMGIALHRLGRLEEARECLARAVRIQRRRGQTAELALVRAVRAGVYFDLGDRGRALQMLRHAAATLRASGKSGQEAEVLQNVGYVAGEMARWSVARPALDRAIFLAHTTGQWRLAVRTYACRAIAMAAEDIFEEAATSLARAQQLPKGRRYPWGDLFIARAKARMAQMCGEWEEMRRRARQGERVAQRGLRVGRSRDVSEADRVHDTWHVRVFVKQPRGVNSDRPRSPSRRPTAPPGRIRLDESDSGLQPNGDLLYA